MLVFKEQKRDTEQPTTQMFLGFPATRQSAIHDTGRASFYIWWGWQFWRVFD